MLEDWGFVPAGTPLPVLNLSKGTSTVETKTIRLPQFAPFATFGLWPALLGPLRLAELRPHLMHVALHLPPPVP